MCVVCCRDGNDVCVCGAPFQMRPPNSVQKISALLFICHEIKVTPNTNGGDLPEKHRWKTISVSSVPKVASDEQTPTTNVAQMALDRKMPDSQRSTDHLGQSIAIRMAFRLHDGS
ncbi:unnamed protein product [Ectocarpus sp. 6 AP-2014]